MPDQPSNSWIAALYGEKYTGLIKNSKVEILHKLVYIEALNEESAKTVAKVLLEDYCPRNKGWAQTHFTVAPGALGKAVPDPEPLAVQRFSDSDEIIFALQNFLQAGTPKDIARYVSPIKELLLTKRFILSLPKDRQELFDNKEDFENLQKHIASSLPYAEAAAKA